MWVIVWHDQKESRKDVWWYKRLQWGIHYGRKVQINQRNWLWFGVSDRRGVVGEDIRELWTVNEHPRDEGLYLWASGCDKN